jgi:hypothetical protein
MNTQLLIALAGFLIAALMGGCAETNPPLPQVHYPVTYQVPVGNRQATSNYGPQNLSVSATQDVTVQPGTPLYFQVVSPIPVTAYVYDKSSPSANGSLLTQMSGTTFTSSVTPDSTNLEFSFQPTQANTSGTLQFTLSDQPIAGAPSAPPEPVPPPQSQ